MRIAFNPKALATFAVKSDRALPEAERPLFTVKYPTIAEIGQIEEFNAQARAETILVKRAAALDQAFAVVLRGWSNLRRPDGTELVYDPAVGSRALDELLTLHEKRELLFELVGEVGEANFPYEKPSASAPSTSPGSSAPGATAPNATEPPPATK